VVLPSAGEQNVTASTSQIFAETQDFLDTFEEVQRPQKRGRAARPRSPHANHYGQAEALHRPFALAVMQAIITFAPVWSNRRLAELVGCDEATSSRIAQLLVQRGAVIKTKMKTAKGTMCIFSAAADCPAPVRRRSSKPRQSGGDCTNANKRRGTYSTPSRPTPASSTSRPPRARARPAAPPEGQQKREGGDTEIPVPPATTETPLPANVVVLPKASAEARLHIRERQSGWHIRFLLARRPAEELARYVALASAWICGLEDDSGPGKAEFERVDKLARQDDFEGHQRREFRRQHPELVGKAWKMRPPPRSVSA
jgi:hypothetical protein